MPVARPAPLRVVAVDRSFSMSAPGRFARALELARAAVGEASAGQRVAVIAFDERADVVAEPGTAADARAALERIEAGFGATRYRSAIEGALDLAAGAPGQLMLVTDLARPGWDDEQPMTVPGDWTTEVRDVGAVEGNVAITAVRREADRVVATIRNAGPTAYTGEVRVDVDGARLSQTRTSVAAGATSDIAMPVRAPAAGSLSVSVDDATGFAADNVRYLALDRAAGRRVLIVTAGGPGRTGGFYLARALDASDGTDDGFAPRIVTGAAVSAMPADEWRAFRALALLSTRGLDRRGRDALGAYVRAGGGLFVAAAPDVEAALLSSALGWQPPLVPVQVADRPLTLGATDLRHPIFRPFGPLAANLGQVRFDRIWRVRPDGWEVAARFADGAPAVLERAEGTGRVVLFASDLDRRWNDFPLHPAFVPFVIETIRHISGSAEGPTSYTPATAPPGAGPGPGVFRLATGQIVTVNVDPRESVPTRMTAGEFQEMMKSGPANAGAPRQTEARQTEAGQAYWRYGLLLMLAALVVESIVGRS